MFFTNTPGRLLLYIKFFFSSRSTRVPEIIRTFQEKFIFQMIRPFFAVHVWILNDESKAY